MYLSAHFQRHEFACPCGCGFNTVDAELIHVLEELRAHFGDRPVLINSGARCPAHNRDIGGAPLSRHLWGQAADIRVRGLSAARVAAYLEARYPDRYGIGSYPSWTHVDVRSYKTRWRRG